MKKKLVLVIIMLHSLFFLHAQLTTISIESTADAFTCPPCPTCNYGTSTLLSQGYASGWNFHSVYKFSFDSIPSDAVITKATLTLTTSDGPSSITSGSVTLKLFSDAWSENTITDNTFSSLGLSSQRILSVQSAEYAQKTFNINMREWVQYWVRGDISNDGFVMFSSNYFNVYSREDNTGHRPKLEIEYFIPDTILQATQNATISDFGTQNYSPAYLEAMDYEYANIRSYVDFDFSKISTNYTFKVYLELPGHGHSTGLTDPLLFTPVVESWNSTISWSNKPNVSTDYRLTLDHPNHPLQDYLIDITGIARTFTSNGSIDLYGFELFSSGYYSAMSYNFASMSDVNAPKIYVLYGGMDVDTISFNQNLSYGAPYIPNGYIGANITEDVNYVLEKTPLVKANSTEGLIYLGDMQKKVTYYDGLGRDIEEVQFRMSPLGSDIIKPIVYDDFGRIVRDYLPFPSSNYIGQFRDFDISGNDVLGMQENFYRTQFETGNNDAFAYSRTIFESSPLNRVIEQGAPGSQFQPSEENTNLQTEHTKKSTYSSNTTYEVINWKIEDDELYNAGYYPADNLYKNITTGEDGGQVIEFKNVKDQVILKESFSGDSTFRTYYVYDDFDLLRVVLPPELANQLIEGNITDVDLINNALFNRLGYYYKYDERKRMVVKKLPGADSTLMVYDSRDRLVLSQDGNLRKRGQWLFTKYDQLNRPIINGLYNSTLTRQQLEGAPEDYYSNVSANKYENLRC